MEIYLTNVYIYTTLDIIRGIVEPIMNNRFQWNISLIIALLSEYYLYMSDLRFAPDKNGLSCMKGVCHQARHVWLSVIAVVHQTLQRDGNLVINL